METAALPQGGRGWPHELMASVFPRWSNTAFRLAIAADFLGGAAAVRDGLRGVVELPAVREGVRRDVDHAHDLVGHGR